MRFLTTAISRVNDNPVFDPVLKNFFQDHLAFTLIFMSPLYFLLSWLTGTYTLLVVEVSFIILGGYYTYKLIKLKTQNETISLIALFHFYILIGHFSALAADYHDTVVGASVVPAFLYLIEKKKYWKSIIPFLFILLTKENFSLWLVFITSRVDFNESKESQKCGIQCSVSYYLSSLFFLVL